jgi:wyosine [tRNA(Phe)-imidazoG37] synthetase (radical SAM superfamily)
MVHDRIGFSTVYGPVPSWRFGRSLGIDAVVGAKTCTFNCIYCQLGKTTVPVTGPEGLSDPVAAENVKSDIDSCLNKIDLHSIDAITFSGSGEPTLNLQLGKMVQIVRELPRKKTPVVLLTNASLLHRSDVRENAEKFDVVCSKLDAGDERSLRIINRPVKEVANLERIIGSIKELKKNLTGKLMTQTMFLRTTTGFTNCEGAALDRLVDAISKIDPDTVQIDTPYRPSTDKCVRHADIEELALIGEKFQRNFNKSRLWIFGIHDKRGRSVNWKGHESATVEVLKLLRRRPCRAVDIADSIGISYKDVIQIVSKLLDKGQIIERTSDREKYFQGRVSDNQE